MMVDQAAELRNLVRRTASQHRDAGGALPRLIVLAGGKGGVGVTTMAVNLSIALADRALRVVLVDADLYRADVAILCSLPERGHVGDILAARRTIRDVLQSGPSGVMVLPGMWAPDHDTPFTQLDQQRLLKQIRSLSPHVDIVVIDTGRAGFDASACFWLEADDVIVLSTPDTISIMDCYATIKMAMSASNACPQLHLIVNQVESECDAQDVHRRIDASARRFLGQHIAYLGGVPRDPRVSQAAAACKPLLLSGPNGPASEAIAQMAVRLIPVSDVKPAAATA